jgi:heme/copper-type cytochrome/quinol oxidase subunit 1
LIGALIRGSNTIVPGHYHASIGAVTAAFMAATWLLLEPLGLPLPAGARLRRLVAVQPALFGGGQLIFAVGFALAGAHGTARKVYGAEQAARTLPQSAGLVVMGIGGLVAVAGGLLYLGLVLRAWRARSARLRAIPARSRAIPARSRALPARPCATWSAKWNENPIRSTPSRS